MRSWLVDYGYIDDRSAMEKKKDEIVDMFSENYKVTSSKTHEYLTWSDGKIRAWLRSNGVPVKLGTRREELLQQMKENYVTTQSSIVDMLNGVQDWISMGASVVEDKARELYEVLRVGLVQGEEAGLKAATTASKSVSSAATKATQTIKAEL